MSRLDAYISRYGDFCAHDNDDSDNDTTDYFIPCACMRGNYVCKGGIKQLVLFVYLSISTKIVRSGDLGI